MIITEVRVRLADQEKVRNDRCKAFVSLVMDGCLVVHDLKVIQCDDRGLFVCFPDRQLTDKCSFCEKKNPLLAAYCNWCGGKLAENRAEEWERCFQDVCHPINEGFRQYISKKVLEKYQEVLCCAAQMPCLLPARCSGG